MTSKSEQLRQLLEEKDSLHKDLTSSEEYLDLMDELEDAQDAVQEIQDKEKDMLSSVAKKEEEIAKLKKDIIKDGAFDEEFLKGKYKNSASVDSSKFYAVIGDLDNFLSRISITQKVVKDYASENEHMKDEIMDCIVPGKPILSDLTI